MPESKTIFQIHTIDASDKVLLQKAVMRAALLPLLAKLPACLIGMEACSGAHHWARAGDDPRHRAGDCPALVASITGPDMFGSGRELAAFLGLAPRQSPCGGKERLGRISKMGGRYLRKLLVAGAAAALRYAKAGGSSSKAWAQALLARKPFKAAAVALANKSARIVRAILTRGGVCRDAIGREGAGQSAPAAA